MIRKLFIYSYNTLHYNKICLLVWTFRTPDLPVGIHSNIPCPSVFKYLKNRSLAFSETLHEVRGQ